MKDDVHFSGTFTHNKGVVGIEQFVTIEMFQSATLGLLLCLYINIMHKHTHKDYE